jgi:S1-C subfamily serine protease
MPPLEAAATPLSRAAMAATAVIVAPDEDGDMRGLAIGTGSVIGRGAHAAFVLTNSHVAIPYLPAGAFRDPKAAQPVWVYLADGRHGPGRVRWVGEPPLDVALVSVVVDDAPAPVPVAPDAGEVEVEAEVFFVPNPFRSGWLVHRGVVGERQPHRTPAGEFSLVLTNLPLQQGDSGSGLFDASGRLVGINTWAVFTAGGRSASVPSGISLPSNVLRQIMDLIRDDSLERLDEPK